MGPKTLVRLLIALVVIGAIAAVFHFADFGGGVSEVASSTDKEKLFTDFPINEVAAVEIREKGGTVNLKKGKKTWEVVQRDGYPASSDTIVTLLRDIWDLKIVQPVTLARSQYDRVQLVPPGEAENPEQAPTILDFANDSGETLASLWLGKVYERSADRPSPMGGMATREAGRYVKTGSSNVVYLVEKTFNDVATDPAEWISQDFFRVEKIETIAIDSGKPKQDWKLVRKTEDGDFSFAKPKESEKKLDQSKVSSMKSAFSNAQIEDVYTGKAAKKTEPDATTFTITTFDGFEYVITAGEKNDVNELPLTVKVSADLPKKRQEGEEESDEEKKRLDKEFEQRLQDLKDKLAREKRLEGHVFKVRSYLVDSIDKKRSELLEQPEDEQSGAQPARPGARPPSRPGGLPPGANLPTPPGRPGGPGAGAQPQPQPPQPQPQPQQPPEPKPDQEPDGGAQEKPKSGDGASDEAGELKKKQADEPSPESSADSSGGTERDSSSSGSKTNTEAETESPAPKDDQKGASEKSAGPSPSDGKKPGEPDGDAENTSPQSGDDQKGGSAKSSDAPSSGDDGESGKPGKQSGDQ